MSSASLVGVKIDLAVESNGAHLTPLAQLTPHEPEDELQLGIRLMQGIGVYEDIGAGWSHVFLAAQRGHRVALALCNLHGNYLPRNRKRAAAYFRDSAINGHALGKHCAFFFC